MDGKPLLGIGGADPIRVSAWTSITKDGVGKSLSKSDLTEVGDKVNKHAAT
jgi:hypothetical protein